MKFYNIKNKEEAQLETALMQGAANDGGLYMPLELPFFSSPLLRQLKGKSFEETAFLLAKKMFGYELKSDEIRMMTRAAFNFEIPLRQIEENVFALELFHGPSMAFKDVGAGFMAQLMQHYIQKTERPVHILVATSGDTGGAVAAAFRNISGVSVSIFYPANRVSKLQEQQLNVKAKNVHAYRVKGTFDDCQQMVKDMLSKKRSDKNCFYTTANSINIARLLPQLFYYFHALAQLPSPSGNVIVAVPSGNFGNLCAGLLAQKSGLLPVKFVAATNKNDTVPRFFGSGKWNPAPAFSTLSNAMDISAPNNFDRIMHLMEGDLQKLKEKVSAYAVSEEETADAIRQLYQQHNYLACPHSAVAWHALKKEMQKHKTRVRGIFLCTAHPVKFSGIYESILPGEKLFECFEKGEYNEMKSPVDVGTDFVLESD